MRDQPTALKRLRGKDRKPRKPRCDAVSSEVVAQIRELRSQGVRLKAICAETGLHKATILKYTRGIEPPDGTSWQSFSTAGGRVIVPSEIFTLGDGALGIKLSGEKNLSAIIDADDREKVASYRWFAHQPNRSRDIFYARCDNQYVGSVFMHNLILPLKPGLVADHISRDPLDNRKCNLRYATLADNAANKTPAPGISGYVGVGFHNASGKWNGHVKCKGRNHSAGYFTCPREAALARDALARQLQGEFAVLNFPEIEP